MRILPVLLLAALIGCGPRGEVERVVPASVANPTRVFVATTRAVDTDLGVPGRERAGALGFGQFVVSVPQQRELGTIPRPRRNQPVDPQRHFALADGGMLTEAAFRERIRLALGGQARVNREVVIFVHGFNTTFIEGVYRVAQLSHDLRLPGVIAHYSWPSLGAPLAYANDRDSALFARDGLQRMIETVAAAGAPRVVLIAHSMGSQLLMETLRQMAIEGSLRQVPLGGVILISPDVDVDVFRSQAQRIGRLPQPFVIVTSQRDRVLQLSARLTGQPDRLGNLTQPERVAELGATVIDVTAFSRGEGHFTLAESPALIGLLGQLGALDAALSEDTSGRLPLVPGTILTLQGTAEAVLNPLADPRARARIDPLRLLRLRLGRGPAVVATVAEVERSP